MGGCLLCLEMFLDGAESLPLNKAMAPINARGAVHAGICTINGVTIPKQLCRLPFSEQNPSGRLVLVPDAHMGNLRGNGSSTINGTSYTIKRTQERQSRIMRLCGYDSSVRKATRGHCPHTNLSFLLSSCSAVVLFPSPISLRSVSTVFLPSSLNRAQWFRDLCRPKQRCASI